MAFLNKGRSKLTTKPARSVKRITKPKAPVKKPGSRVGIKSAIVGSRSPDKKLVAPTAPTSPRKPPSRTPPSKKPKNVKQNVAGQAAARASLNANRSTNFGGERRATTGKKVTRTTAKPVKSRASVKVSQRSKKMK